MYQATVKNTTNGTVETYIGLASTTFKERLAIHKQSFKRRDLNQTTLSSHIWLLKDNEKNFNIKYKIIDRGRPYTAGYKKCGLCTKEKTWIITRPDMGTLNKRTELTTKCRHRDKFLLDQI